MRPVFYYLSIAVLAGTLASCKDFKSLTKQNDGDDVYYSLKDAKKERAAEKKRKEEEEKRKQEEALQRQKEENNRKAMATSPGSDYYNEPFDYDDYYDYEYAARLRRFHHPVQGSGYYGNYYTNSYFYNNNPYLYGTSVYNSYNFWGPSAYYYSYCPSTYFYYNSGWPWGMGMYNGWGQPWGGYYDPWMYNGWGYNSYYWGPGWNGGWYGPMTPIYSQYWGGIGLGWNGGNGWGWNNNYYFNSFDNNSYYYGPRRTASATDGRPAGSGGPAFGERFVNAVATENNLAEPGIREVNQVVGVPASSTQGRNNTVAPATQGNSVVRPEPSTGNTNTGRNDQQVVPPPPAQSGSTQGRQDVVPPPPAGNQQAEPRQNMPPAQQQQADPRNSTPPPPDFNRPKNSNDAPPRATERGREVSSPNFSSPSNGGGNNSSPQPRSGNNGSSISRPR